MDGMADHANHLEAATNHILVNARDWMDDFIKADGEKNRLIHALLDERNTYAALIEQNEDQRREIERLNVEIINLSMNLESEMESRRSYQLKLKSARELEQNINNDSFIAVLVDGDGAKFADHFILDASDGAPRAGRALMQAVRDYIGENDQELHRIPIVARAYANLSGLAKALRMSSVIDHDDDMIRFAEQFTSNHGDFDFINVGRGTENTDSKIRDMLSHYFNIAECKKIFIACCHDNGYSHDLRKYINHEHRDKIVLVETTPADPDFQRLGFPITHFNQVFRSSPLAYETKRMSMVSPVTTRLPSLPSHGPIMNSPATISSLLPEPQQQSPQPQRFVPTPPASTNTPSPTLITSVTEAVPHISRTSSIVTSGKGGVSISYATAGGPKEHQNITVKPEKKQPPKTIVYNCDGCRIDPPISHPSNTPAQATYQEKLLKVSPNAFCNDHYLIGRCNRRNCERIHDVSLTAAEVSIHRYKARTSVCPRGPECDDYSCYLSHHCLKDPRCQRGSNCKFSNSDYGNLHLNSDEKLKPSLKWIEGTDFPVKCQ